MLRPRQAVTLFAAANEGGSTYCSTSPGPFGATATQGSLAAESGCGGDAVETSKSISGMKR